MFCQGNQPIDAETYPCTNINTMHHRVGRIFSVEKNFTMNHWVERFLLPFEALRMVRRSTVRVARRSKKSARDRVETSVQCQACDRVFQCKQGFATHRCERGTSPAKFCHHCLPYAQVLLISSVEKSKRTRVLYWIAGWVCWSFCPTFWEPLGSSGRTDIELDVAVPVQVEELRSGGPLVRFEGVLSTLADAHDRKNGRKRVNQPKTTARKAFLKRLSNRFNWLRRSGIKMGVLEA